MSSLQKLHDHQHSFSWRTSTSLTYAGSIILHRGSSPGVWTPGVFLECVEDSFLTQLVQEPTRGGAPLDLLFTNREGLVGDVKDGDCLGQNDHEVVEFSILGDVGRVTSRTAVLNFRRVGFDLFRSLVAGVPWVSLLKGKGVQEAWTLLKKEVSKAQEQAVPVSCKASWRGRRPAWMNHELLLRLWEKKKVYVRWKKGRATWGDYKEVAKIC